MRAVRAANVISRADDLCLEVFKQQSTESVLALKQLRARCRCRHFSCPACLRVVKPSATRTIVPLVWGYKVTLLSGFGSVCSQNFTVT